MSDQGLRDFIKMRRANIRARGAPLWNRRTDLKRELSELEEKIAELTREWDELEKAASAIGANEDDTSGAGSPNAKFTIKEAILKVLAENSDGLPSQEILDQINTKFFDNAVARTSFSPQLSRLKFEGEVAVMNGKYFLNQNRSDAEPSFFERRV